MKLSTRTISIVLCLCLCLVLLTSCGFSQDDLDEAWLDGHEDGYEYGYDSGYEAGLWDGVDECKDDFAEAVRSRYSDVEHATLNGRDLHPEEAIMVLNDYLDGVYVSADELESAIKSITDFYYDWQSVIANIEDLDVDIYFD